MELVQTESSLHWNYFLALEQDLEKVARYIEFNEDNYNTYSIELAHLLLAIGSEVDVLMKALCKVIDPDVQRKDIGSYRYAIQSKSSDFMEIVCQIPKYGMMSISPWEAWEDNSSSNPEWWDAYNDVKHKRSENFGKANLKNVLNAISALYIVNFYWRYVSTSDPEFLSSPQKDSIKTSLNRETLLIKLPTMFHFMR